MSMGFNKVILMGNMTRDPQQKALPSGTIVCEFGIAVNRRWKSQTGEDREEVCFVDCKAYNKQADVILRYLRKGSGILVEGRLVFDQWVDKMTGQNRSRMYVYVEGMQMIGGRQDQQGGYPQQQYGAQQGGYPQQQYGAPQGGYPQQQYGAPQGGYPQQQYGAPQGGYPQQYGAQPQYGAPQGGFPHQYGAPQGGAYPQPQGGFGGQQYGQGRPAVQNPPPAPPPFVAPPEVAAASDSAPAPAAPPAAFPAAEAEASSDAPAAPAAPAADKAAEDDIPF